VFNAAQARRAVRNFERRGLDGTAAPMIAALGALSIRGGHLLEVGAGPGTAVVSLLEAGMESAIAYDISPSYEAVAGALFQGRGVETRVEWHIGDYLVAGDHRDADVVFLNRVVCCYPDMAPLVDAVAGRTRRLLALSYPRRRWFTRSAIRVMNAYLALRRVPFRTFVHDPDAIAARVAAAGLRPIAAGGSGIWEWKVWQRAVNGVEGP
jgi:magnesium-protoporphyrin O-methyltransferase